MRHATAVAFVLVSAVAAAVAACGSSGSTSTSTPTTPSTPTTSTTNTTTTFQGTVAGADGKSGPFSVTIQSAVSSSAAARQQAGSTIKPLATVTASGTFSLGGAATSTISGTYDTSSGALSLTGGGVTFTGSISGSALTGSFTGSGGGSFSSLNATQGTVTQYCGTYVAGTETGTWSLELSSGGTVLGQQLPQNQTGNAVKISGTATGSTISGTAGSNTFTGTIQNGTLSGTFQSGGVTGSFTGSSGCTPTPASGGPSISGTWSGTASGALGSTSTALTLTLTQSGTQVSGAFSAISSPNAVTATAPITGSISGSTLSFSSGQFTDSHGCNGQLTGATGQISGTSMALTLTVTNFASCGSTSNQSAQVQATLTQQP